MEDSDPYSWSIDQVIAQICHPNSSLRQSVSVKSSLDFQKLESTFRANDIDGENLLSLEDANVKDDLGVSSFGQRRDLRKIILYLRSASELYEASLATPTGKATKRPISDVEVSSPDPYPPPQPKKRRIQPLNISTQPLTNPDDFDPANLSDQWQDFLDRHPQDSEEEILRPYAESDHSMELDSDDNRSLIAEMEDESDHIIIPSSSSRIPQDVIDRTIDQAIEDFRARWNDTKRPKRYKIANRRWRQAAKAKTRKPQQYILNQELQQIQVRLTKFRKAIVDMSTEYHKIEDVRQNCANLQATVEDCAEREYYLEVLASNDPPEPPEQITLAQVQVEDLPEGEEILSSSDLENHISDTVDESDSDLMDMESEDEDEVILPYDPTDHDWNPNLPPSPSSDRSLTDVFADPFSSTFNKTPASSVQQFHLNKIPKLVESTGNEILSPIASRSRPLPSDTMMHEIIESPGHNESQRVPSQDDDYDLPTANLDNDDFESYLGIEELRELPRSSYRGHGASRDNAIMIGSSPSAADDRVSDHSVHTPPLNPVKTETSRGSAQAQPSWPDIQTTRRLKWFAISDERTALCKAVYGVKRTHAKEVLDLVTPLTLSEMTQRLRALIDLVWDEQQDSSDDDYDSDLDKQKEIELLWLRLFVTFLFKEGYSKVWNIPAGQLDAAEEQLPFNIQQFDRLLKSLLRHYIDTETAPAVKNGSNHGRSRSYKESISSITSNAIPKTPHHLHDSLLPLRTPPSNLRRRSTSYHTDETTSDSESVELNPSSTVKRRKRIVQESQEALEQQAAALTRTHEEEQRLQVLMEQLSSQHAPVEGRRIPINTDRDNIVFLDQHIASRIKDHQISGVQFLWRELIQDSKHHGALLAHTMGLGKTMQVITFLVTLAKCSTSSDPKVRGLIPAHLQSLKILILCPASLLDNWGDELLVWTPQNNPLLLGRVYKASGSRAEKSNIVKAWVAGRRGILIISYESIRSFLDDKKANDQEQQYMQDALLNGPAIVVADEAHKMKNAKSATNKLAQKFRTTSRIALTGSPLNNHLEEYHTMINWIAPGYLGDMKQFKAKYSDPIERGLYEDSNRHHRRISLRRLYVLKRDLAPKVDRKDISAIAADMPQKTEFYITIPLTQVQHDIYSTMVQHFLGALQNGQTVSKGMNAQLWSWLAILSWLCNHPSILIRKLEEKNSIAEVTDDEDNDDETHIPANIDLTQTPLTALLPQLRAIFETHGFNNMIDPSLSARTMITQMLIEEAIQEGQKTLLFSHSIPTLDFLQHMLQGMGVQFLRIDGSTRTDQRQAYTKDFNHNTDIKVFLISTRAGGLGLNLQGAIRVIIYDFGFNPSWEEQAVGRAYRLGQKQPVFVYKMRAGGTFEDTIHNKAIFKTQLFSRVVDQKNVIRHAKKDVEDYLFVPQQVDTADFSECMGKDDLLDRVVARAPGAIRDLVLTETFQREDEDDELTMEERTKADEEATLEALARDNPAEYERLSMQIRQRELVEQAARRQALAQNAASAPQSAQPISFDQIFQPSVSHHVQFPGGTPEAAGVARGVQEEPLPEKNDWGQ